ALLRRAQGALRRGLAERGDHHGVEVQRDAPELNVDHVLAANRALDQPGADEPELQDLAGVSGDGVISLCIAGGDGGCAFHRDRDSAQRSALLARDLASDRFLLCEERRGDEESAEQHYEQSCSHDGRLPVFGVKSRSYGEDSDCQELRSPEARREPREHRGLVTTRSRNSTMLQRAIRTVSSGSPPPCLGL